jgi:hypothetical protein
MSQQKIILKLLRPKAQKSRMFGAWLALCAGLLLLLLTALSWFDFQAILSGKERRDAMSEYVVIGKKITDANMGSNVAGNLFSDTELRDLKAVSGVQDVGQLHANHFPVTAKLGGSFGFQTELFLESVADDFLDDKPNDWNWESDASVVPVILSNDFLNLYNYGFALSQGLPQISAGSVQAIPFMMEVGPDRQVFRVHIVGFTDRISSILVPQNFLSAMNRKYGSAEAQSPARMILKVTDPSDPVLVNYLHAHNYTANADQLRWSRIRTAVQTILSVLGIVALLIVGMGILSFVLFLEITVYRASGQIRLMQQIGYAPRKLQKVLTWFFLPWMASAVMVAAAFSFVFHLLLRAWAARLDLTLSYADAWIIPVLLVCFLLLLVLLLRRSTKAVLRTL